MPQVQVKTPSADYPILVEEGLLTDVDRLLSTLSISFEDIWMISNSTVYPLYGEDLAEGLRSRGHQVYHSVIPDGEEYKTLGQAEELLTFALKRRLSRRTLVLAVGGGVVGDIAGFVASIYLRGVPFVQVPTTLLAQVDSSVGGKVAVNHPLGKNMIGAFYQPRAVWADLATLASLPEREWRTGLAEVIKYGLIWDKDLAEFLLKERSYILKRDPRICGEVVARCCRIKAEIVSADERENGLRAILNFGHTVGHSLERATDYRFYRHGEAVAVGMAIETLIALEMGRLDSGLARRILDYLAAWQITDRFPSVSSEELIAGMYHDKKTVDGQLTFVLPEEFGRVRLVSGVDPETVGRALTAYRR